jgi:hypothetical protein
MAPALLVFLAATADAAEPAKSEAALLFERGKVLYDLKRFAEACAALAESDRMAPSVNTVGLLAACHEQLGRLSLAHRKYLETAARARKANDERESFAREMADKIRQRLAIVRVRSFGNEPSLEIACQGERVALDEPVWVDPGPVRIEARAPGRRSFAVQVNVAPREDRQVMVPALALSGAPDRRAEAPRAPQAGSTQRTAGWIALIGGGAVLTAGAVFGLVAVAKKGELEEDPRCPNRCSDAGAVDSYNAMRHASTAGIVVGIVGAGAGIALLWTAPSARPSSARVWITPDGSIRGVF